MNLQTSHFLSPELSNTSLSSQHSNLTWLLINMCYEKFFKFSFIAILHPVCNLNSNSWTELEFKPYSHHNPTQDFLLSYLQWHKDYFVSRICFFCVWA